MSAGSELTREQVEQDDEIASNAQGVAFNRAAVRRLEGRVKALEDAGAPVEPPVKPPVNPPVEPPIIAPPDPPTTRRFGCNIGYKVGKSWSPDKPDDPRYAEIVKPFGGYRYMDWWRTNDDINAGGGITDAQKAMLDRQIDLCNQNDSAIYLCLLYHDSDETIRYKVGRVRDRIKPGLPRYYEWINEPWNGTSTAVARELAREAGKVRDAKTGKLRNARVGDNQFFDAWAAHINRVFPLVKQTDPEAVTVLGCLTANVWVAKQLYKGRIDVGLVDAHGLTFYFGSGLGGAPDPNTTVDNILASSNQKITDKEIPRIQEHARWSKSVGARIVGYEGLSHYTIKPALHQSHVNVWRNLNQANRDPRIIPLCERIASAAEAEGYEMMFIFNLLSRFDQWGSWGLGEDMDTIEQAHKYRWAGGTA